MSDTVALLGKIITEPVGRDAIHIAVAPVTAGETLRPGYHVGFLKDGTVGEESAQYVGIVDPFLTRQVKEGERFWLYLYPGSITSLRHAWTHPAFAEEGSPVTTPPVPARQSSPAPAAEAGASWRTPTVLALCKQMRDSKDYSALPVLADALEDGGYQDAAVLGQCRKSHRWAVKSIVGQRVLSLVESDESAAAVARLDEMAEQMDITYNALMEAAERWVDSEDYTTEYGSEHWRDTFYGLVDEFWPLYEIVTGLNVENKGAFFSCSC